MRPDMDPGPLDAARLRRLIDAGRSLVSHLDLDELLERLIAIAADLTGARYAALGILDTERRELERFLTHGIDAEGRRAIGDLPRGRGILGVLIDDPRPLRLASVGDDARSYGFPPGHPPMTTFLGAPVMIRGEAWGNLYLTEKAGGAEFTAADEEAVVILAEWAGHRDRERAALPGVRAPPRRARAPPCAGSRRRRRSRARSAGRPTSTACSS